MDLGPKSLTLPPVIQGFPAACALPLCPDALFLQECRHLHGEFHGPACGHNGPYTPNVLFWSCILFFSTFVLSSSLKMFKTSRYFPTRVGRRWWNSDPTYLMTCPRANLHSGSGKSGPPEVVCVCFVCLYFFSSPHHLCIREKLIPIGSCCRKRDYFFLTGNKYASVPYSHCSCESGCSGRCLFPNILI